MKLVFLGVVALTVVLGLTNVMGYGQGGYGYKQSYYPVPMPFLVGGQRQEGGGGFFALIGLIFIIIVLFGFNSNNTSTSGITFRDLDDDDK